MMKHLNRIASLALVLMLLSSSALAETSTDAKYAGIEWTNVADEVSRVDWGQATVELDAPIDSVAKYVTNYADYSEFMPHFKTSKVLSQRGDQAMVYMEVGVMKDTVTLWSQLRMRQSTSEGGAKVIDARFVKGNMKEFSALWRLEPTADGKKTKVIFRILVDPNMPLPASVFTNENVKAARKTLAALRDRMAIAR
ncbi:MAG: SRPBCC family protein [Polyangiales bacterium]